MELSVLLVSVVLATVVAALVWSLKLARTCEKSEDKEKCQKSGRRESGKAQSSNVSKQVKKKPAAAPVVKESKAAFTHSWLLTTLKGHTGNVLDMDFSPDGKHIVTCSEDRSLMLWTLKLASLPGDVTELNMKDIRTVRSHVPFDYATRIRWSPDGKALLTVRASTNEIEIYKVAKKPEGGGYTVTPTHTLPKVREADLIAIGLASTGRFIMTCTPKNEVDIVDLKGNVLASFTTNQMETYCAKISPCARWVAISGFTPDVRVWEVLFTKSGEFDRVGRAFELTGHTSGIWSLDFSSDSSKMVSVSKDGTWRLYNTNIDYKKGQLAQLISSGKWTVEERNQKAFAALSADGLVVAIATGSNLYLYSANNGELVKHIESIHSEPVTAVCFDATSRFVLTAGDRYVRVFHNVAGYKIAVTDLESKLRKATNQAMKERIQNSLHDIQTKINLFL